MKTTTYPIGAGRPLRIPAQYSDSHPTVADQPPQAATPGSPARTDPSGPQRHPDPNRTEIGPGHGADRPAAAATSPKTPTRPTGTGRPPLRRGTRAAEWVELPAVLTRFLRIAAGVELLAGIWLLLVAADRLACGLKVCEVATLDGHQQITGLVAVIAGLTLSAAATCTGGLTRAPRWCAVVAVLVAAVGGIAVVGVLLVGAVVLSLLALMTGVALAVLIGTVPGHLTR